MTKAVELLSRKSAAACKYAKQFKEHIDPNDPKVESKLAYLDGVGLLFSQAMTLSHSANFSETLAGLRQHQIQIDKKMSFFGKGLGSKNSESAPDLHSYSAPVI